MVVKYILGEDKYVRILIHGPDGMPFEIKNATYQMSQNEEIIKEGRADVEDHYIDVKLCPPHKGSYLLIITYEIADTIHKTKVAIDVT